MQNPQERLKMALDKLEQSKDQIEELWNQYRSLQKEYGLQLDHMLQVIQVSGRDAEHNLQIIAEGRRIRQQLAFAEKEFGQCLREYDAAKTLVEETHVTA